jgi:hypothetical protein
VLFFQRLVGSVGSGEHWQSAVRAVDRVLSSDIIVLQRGPVWRRFRVRSHSCAEQFRAMAFAQLTLRENLHDIEAYQGA